MSAEVLNAMANDAATAGKACFELVRICQATADGCEAPSRDMTQADWLALATGMERVAKEVRTAANKPGSAPERWQNLSVELLSAAERLLLASEIAAATDGNEVVSIEAEMRGEAAAAKHGLIAKLNELSEEIPDFIKELKEPAYEPNRTKPQE